MKLMVAVLGLSLASAAPALSVTTPEPVLLAIRVQGDRVQATHLPAYDPQVPIAVTVTGTAKGGDDLSVVASGPAGRSARIPLARGADGAFIGMLSLSDPGTWRLQLAARYGRLRTLTLPVMLDVQPLPPSNAGPIGWAVGSAIFVVLGGGGFLVLRRLGARESPLELDRAA